MLRKLLTAVLVPYAIEYAFDRFTGRRAPHGPGHTYRTERYARPARASRWTRLFR